MVYISLIPFDFVFLLCNSVSRAGKKYFWEKRVPRSHSSLASKQCFLPQPHVGRDPYHPAAQERLGTNWIAERGNKAVSKTFLKVKEGRVVAHSE